MLNNIEAKKEGMKIVAKAQEDFNKKQAEATREVGNRILKKFDEQNAINDAMIGDLEKHDNILKSSEKKKLYDLNTTFDIQALDENEKEFLVAVLFQISNDENNENQKQFIRSIKSYVDVKEPQIRVDISCIENIEKLTTQKAILQTIMEYLFLENENFDFFESYTQLFNYFSVNPKLRTEIKEKIQTIYNATGGIGLSEKYGYVAIIDEPNFEVEESIGQEENEAKITELIINNILNIKENESKFYENQIVHINNFIDCKGNLEFQNCIINYNETEVSDEIELSEKASIKFINCKITCINIDEKPFVNCKGNNEIIVDSCQLINCSYLIKTKNSCNLSIKNSVFINPSKDIISGAVLTGEILGCTINFNGIDDKNKVLLGEVDREGNKLGYSNLLNRLFLNSSSFNFICEERNFLIKDCFINGDVSVNSLGGVFKIFDIRSAIYENCTFEEIKYCISESKTIKKSLFINCESVIDLRFPVMSFEIEDCIFNKCSNIFRAKDTSGVIKNCQFVECKNNIFIGKNVNIEFCEFYNISNDLANRACLEFGDGESKIRKCSFNGINLDNAFLVLGKTDAKPINNNFVHIEECDFKNCVTKNEGGKIIKEVCGYHGGFPKKWNVKKVVSITDCKGLENINKSSGYIADIIIKTETSTGAKIGASLIGLAVGGIAGAVAGPIVLNNFFKDGPTHIE